jgi:hypothetical protein
VSSGPAWATGRDPVSKILKTKPKKKTSDFTWFIVSPRQFRLEEKGNCSFVYNAP